MEEYKNYFERLPEYRRYADGKDRPVPEMADKFMAKYLAEAEYILRHLETSAVKLREMLLQEEALRCLSDEVKTLDEAYKISVIYRFEKELIDISIVEKDGIIKIEIPGLLPHRKSKPNILFLQLLREEISNFSKNCGTTDYWEISQDGVLLIFQHCYNAEFLVRDNDNPEIKSVIDILVEGGLIKNDGGDYLSVLSTAVIEMEAKTRILLVPKQKAMLFINGQEYPKI